MSVSSESERSCSSPLSSGSSDTGSYAHMKLKRRWIEMSGVEKTAGRELVAAKRTRINDNR